MEVKEQPEQQKDEQQERRLPAKTQADSSAPCPHKVPFGKEVVWLSFSGRLLCWNVLLQTFPWRPPSPSSGLNTTCLPAPHPITAP